MYNLYNVYLWFYINKSIHVYTKALVYRPKVLKYEFYHTILVTDLDIPGSRLAWCLENAIHSSMVKKTHIKFHHLSICHWPNSSRSSTPSTETKQHFPCGSTPWKKKPWSRLIWPCCQVDFCRFFRHISLHLNDNLMQTTYDLVAILKETRFGLSLYS